MTQWRLIAIFLYCLVFANHTQSQQKNILSVQEYLQLVAKNHPVAKQADLLTLKARANLTKVRGAFDPELFLYYDGKEFDSKDYYQYLQGGVSWNTASPIKFKGSFQQTEGFYINPQEYTPKDGLYTAGASVSLGKGLLMDEQRLALRQAKVFKQAAETEQLIMINQLYLKAMYAYLNWFQMYNVLEIQSEAFELAEQRLNLIRTSYLFGDKPAMDTVETFTLYQSRTQSLKQAETDFLNATLELSNHLWDEKQVPINNLNIYSAPTSAEFIKTTKTECDSLFMKYSMEYLVQPELLLYNYKNKNLLLEKRWKLEKLKPKIDVQYNFLSTQWNEYDWEGFGRNNYKFGVRASLPLFLREGRGDLKLTQLKLQELKWEVQLKQQSIKNKITQYYNEYLNLLNQLEVQRSVIDNNARLLEAEKINYNNGEGSIFLINTRENNYLKAKEKYIELLAKYEKTIWSFKSYMGLI